MTGSAAATAYKRVLGRWRGGSTDGSFAQPADGHWRRAPSSGWVWLAAAVLGNSAGNVLLKLASGQSGAGAIPYSTVSFLGGVFFFGLGLLAYTRALVGFPLAVAYPTMVGGSIAVITMAAVGLFGERIDQWHALGIALIFAGVFILTRQSEVEL